MMPDLKLTRNGRRLIYVGVAAYLIFLIHSLPASFLSRFILPSISTTRALNLQGVRGSIWDGQASNALINNFDLGKLHWHLKSWGLLLGKLKLHLTFNRDNVNGKADVSLGLGGRLSADDVDLQLPAQSLMPLLYGYPVSIDGELRSNLKQVSIEPGHLLQAQGRVVWRNAALRAPQNIEMGDFLITIDPVDLGSKILIKDQGQGAIETEITITATGAGDYRMNGWLKPRDPNQQTITDALRMMGRADSSGRYWVGYNGKIRNW